MDHPNAIDLGSVSARETDVRSDHASSAGGSRATLRFVLACCAIPAAWTGAMLTLAWAVRF